MHPYVDTYFVLLLFFMMCSCYHNDTVQPQCALNIKLANFCVLIAHNWLLSLTKPQLALVVMKISVENMLFIFSKLFV